jgi:hypothetical protein
MKSFLFEDECDLAYFMFHNKNSIETFILKIFWSPAFLCQVGGAVVAQQDCEKNFKKIKS